MKNFLILLTIIGVFLTSCEQMKPVTKRVKRLQVTWADSTVEVITVVNTSRTTINDFTESPFEAIDSAKTSRIVNLDSAKSVTILN